MSIALKARPQAGIEGITVTKAVVNAAERLGLTAQALGSVIGVSGPTVSRMKKQEFALERGSKPFELALLFIRLFRSLDAIAGGEEAVTRQWLRNANTALGGQKPAEKILSVSGLVDVLAYLDARRALV
ncbi:MbcA/ParS/Xre antitoxin family protein [Pararhizobium sp.]|uniref:MbcA/ParS/Xre antitoxin family protein n=1 Tax=Pararhizobium sp. TaxID=1977563 RepID=UPI002718B11A|nr:MbcA/ParS/Xre antitoxin family protein [Pararhizobium sp.]MDO9417222.1 MbcA/ParS/Xre antitoxin family protein [Pararhizobium sp.]